MTLADEGKGFDVGGDLKNDFVDYRVRRKHNP